MSAPPQPEHPDAHILHWFMELDRLNGLVEVADAADRATVYAAEESRAGVANARAWAKEMVARHLATWPGGDQWT